MAEQMLIILEAILNKLNQLNLLQVKKEDISFLGWHDGEKLINAIPSNSIGTLKLKATLKINTYQINYNLNNGTNHPQNKTDFTVESNTITLYDANKEGHRFLGWLIHLIK